MSAAKGFMKDKICLTAVSRARALCQLPQLRVSNMKADSANDLFGMAVCALQLIATALTTCLYLVRHARTDDGEKALALPRMG